MSFSLYFTISLLCRFALIAADTNVSPITTTPTVSPYIVVLVEEASQDWYLSIILEHVDATSCSDSVSEMYLDELDGWRETTGIYDTNLRAKYAWDKNENLDSPAPFSDYLPISFRIEMTSGRYIDLWGIMEDLKNGSRFTSDQVVCESSPTVEPTTAPPIEPTTVPTISPSVKETVYSGFIAYVESKGPMMIALVALCALVCCVCCCGLCLFWRSRRRRIQMDMRQHQEAHDLSPLEAQESKPRVMISMSVSTLVDELGPLPGSYPGVNGANHLSLGMVDGFPLERLQKISTCCTSASELYTGAHIVDTNRGRSLTRKEGFEKIH